MIDLYKTRPATPKATAARKKCGAVESALLLLVEDAADAPVL